MKIAGSGNDGEWHSVLRTQDLLEVKSIMGDKFAKFVRTMNVRLDFYGVPYTSN